MIARASGVEVAPSVNRFEPSDNTSSPDVATLVGAIDQSNRLPNKVVSRRPPARIWSTNRSSRPSKPRAGEWLLLGEHLLLHAAPLMWLNDRTIVVLQDRSPRARCQDPTRREDAAERRRGRLFKAVDWTPRSSKAVGAPWVGLNFVLPQQQ